MSTLAALSGVPAATIKHYVREGLLPGPTLKGRNVAYYDRALTGRVRKIKELQRSRFLPLKVIRDVLDTDTLPSRDETLGAAIARVLSDRPESERRTRAELVSGGMSDAELDWMIGIGLVTPRPEDGAFGGDDLELFRVLGAARRAGISASMLPITILGEYAEAMRRLVSAELRLFREGVVPKAGEDLPTLAEAATALSERLVVLLRRKLLLPTLRELASEGPGPKSPGPKSGSAETAKMKAGTRPRRKKP